MENFDKLPIKISISSPIMTVMGMILITDTQTLEDADTSATSLSVPFVSTPPLASAKFQHHN